MRIPASLTGTVGLKTTLGRWSADGIVPLSPSLDTPGILTRSVADSAFAFTALDGAAVPGLDGLGGCRIGVGKSFFFDDLGPGVGVAVDTALKVLNKAGVRLTDLALPGAKEVYEIYFRGGIVSPELYQFLKRELPEWLETLDPKVKRRVDFARDLPAWEYIDRKAVYAAQGRAAIAALKDVDVLVGPTTPITAPALTEFADDENYGKLNMRC